VDGAGNAYILGSTRSTDFPTANAIQPKNKGSQDLFVTKLNASGSALVYSTYIGGSGDEAFIEGTQYSGHFGGITVDLQGNAYAAADTQSADFPVKNPFQSKLAGGRDLVVFGLDPTGALSFATYLGGSKDETHANIAIDPGGAVYVTGRTLSPDFPTLNAVQSTFGGFQDAFAAKLSPAGNSLVFSTYLGGTASDEGGDLVVDANGSVYVTGTTASPNFPTMNPLQTTFAGGGSNLTDGDVFLSKLDPAGAPLSFSTYLGGALSDVGTSLALDRFGNILLAGFTRSSDFPTTPGSVVQPGCGTDSRCNVDFSQSLVWSDGFILKIDPTGTVNRTEFAQFANGAGVSSSLILVNPSNTETASGSVSFFSDDGAPLYTSFNDNWFYASTSWFRIPPLGSFTLTTDGAGLLQAGAAVATSNVPLGGVVRFALPGLGITGVGQSTPLQSLLIPVIRDAGSGANTGLAFRNPDKSPAQLSLSLRASDGREIAGGAAAIELPGYGHLSRFINELFPAADSNNLRGTLYIASGGESQKIAALSLQLGSVPGEFTALPVTPVQPSLQSTQLVFPHFADGAGWTSSIFLTNPSNSIASCELAFYDDHGSPITVPIAGQAPAQSVLATIPAFGGAVLSTQGQANLVSGSVRIRSNVPVGGALRFALPGLGIAAVDAAAPTTGFIMPVIRSTQSSVSTGFAVTSDGSPATLDLILRNPQGEPVPSGRASIQLQASGHASLFIEQLFPFADTREFQGTITATSTGAPVAATAIQIGSKAGELIALPVVPLR